MRWSLWWIGVAIVGFHTESVAGAAAGVLFMYLATKEPEP